MTKEDEKFLRRAIELARKGMDTQVGGPFGAIVVKDGKIVGEGSNSVTSTNDPTAHAEVMAIREACRTLEDFQLTDCVLYTSCEPCPMCLGAIYWAHISRVVYACSREDAAAVDFDDEFIYEEIARPFEERRIPMKQLLRAEGVEVFKVWSQKSDRLPY
ncbi:MAG: nucleoside deaminase [Bacteroidota bacterium]